MGRGRTDFATCGSTRRMLPVVGPQAKAVKMMVVVGLVPGDVTVGIIVVIAGWRTVNKTAFVERCDSGTMGGQLFAAYQPGTALTFFVYSQPCTGSLVVQEKILNLS